MIHGLRVILESLFLRKHAILDTVTPLAGTVIKIVVLEQLNLSTFVNVLYPIRTTITTKFKPSPLHLEIYHTQLQLQPQARTKNHLTSPQSIVNTTPTSNS